MRQTETPGKPQECPCNPRDCASCDYAMDCFPLIFISEEERQATPIDSNRQEAPKRKTPEV